MATTKTTARKTTTRPRKAATKPASSEQHAPITKADYPNRDDKLVLVKDMPKGLGADQRSRWDICKAAEAQAKKDKVQFTADYLAKFAKDGRRTLRRAARAGLFSSHPYSKGGQK